MSWNVSEEAVAAIQGTAGQLQTLTEALEAQAAALRQSFEENQAGLGYHSAGIGQLLEETESALRDASLPVKKLQLKLSRAAAVRQQHIDNNPYGASGGVSGAGGGGGVSGGGGGGAVQTEHRDYIEDPNAAVGAVQADVLAGSGRNVSRERAAEMYRTVQYFTGFGFTPIRDAYGNANADPRFVREMQTLDDYIRSAPKWRGSTIYRGINVPPATADEILAGPTVDMLGPASWSSEQRVANTFSYGRDGKGVRLIFVLRDNRSGASVTHISTCDGVESEVTAPSGVIYAIDSIRKGSDVIFIDVHETEAGK